MNLTLWLILAGVVCIIIAWIFDRQNQNKYIKDLYNRIGSLKEIIKQTELELADYKEVKQSLERVVNNCTEENNLLRSQVIELEEKNKELLKEIETLKNKTLWEKLFEKFI